MPNNIAFKKAEAKTKLLIRSSKKKKWSNTCSGLDLRKDGRKAWRLLNNLAGSRRKTNPKPMTTKNNTTDGDKQKANTFNKYFASVNKAKRKSKLDKALLKILKGKEKMPTANIAPFEENLTMQELEKALQRTKNGTITGRG